MAFILRILANPGTSSALICARAPYFSCVLHESLIRSNIRLNQVASFSTGKARLSSNAPVIKGKIAKKIPKRVKLEEGKKYSWCACGLSKKQPFCDGTHSKVEDCKMQPVRFEVKKTGDYWLCRCKQTNNRPYCDLSHVKTFLPPGLRKVLGIKL